MFKDIFLFELKYRVKRPATYVYFVIYALVGLLYGAITYGSLGLEASLAISGGGKTFFNAPFTLHNIIAGVGSAIGVFAIAAFMGVPIYRDFEHGVHSLYFTKPISKFSYMGGRFLGSFVWTIFSLSGLIAGFILALYLPNVVEEKMGPFVLYYYLKPFFMNVVPFVVFAGSVFFATVTLTRNSLFIYLNAIMMLVLLFISGSLVEQIDNKFLASLLDPTGGVAIQTTTEFWTMVEKNTQTIPYSASIILNQVIWVGMGLAILVFTYFRFQFSHQSSSAVLVRRKAEPAFKQIGDSVKIQKIVLPSVKQTFSSSTNWSLLMRLTRIEFKDIVSSVIFLAICGMGVFFLLINVIFAGQQIYETSFLPVTYQILDILNGSFFLFLLAIIIFYSGEVVWKERSSKVNLMYDALPIPNWVTSGSKLLSLFGVLIFISFVMMFFGIMVQAFQGYFRFELDLYVKALFFYQLLPLLTFCTFAYFVQVMVNNKYLGFFVVVLFFFLNSTILSQLGVEDRLVAFNSATGLAYSDMNGYGHFVHGYLSFRFYWLSLALMLFVLASLFTIRGTDNTWANRRKNALQNFSLLQKLAFGFGLISFISLGSYIYYNTHVLNDYQTSKESQKLQAQYEKKFKKYESVPQAKITGVKLAVDVFPYQQGMKAKGSYTLKNKGSENVSEIHLMLPGEPKDYAFKFKGKAKEKLADTKFNYFIYSLNKALKPGSSLSFDFEVEYESQGFRNRGSNTNIVYNGTFFNNFAYLPLLGYQSNYELGLDDIRKKYDLKPRPRVPSIDDKKAQQENFISQTSDFIDFEATVSTVEDQIAIAPGYLQKEWKENGRRYFHYKMDSPILNFYSILSGRFKVKKDTWKNTKGEDVSLEIYYHPQHDYNLDRMMKGMKKALSYYSKNFGPYQHRQARIIEFPRYAGFAQSFPNTIPFSESLGFIADVDDSKDIDYVFYVTAHEIAHQWWAHQVVPANTQGANTISESMSQYGALMVMEKEYGADKMKKFLSIELRNYLQGRGGEIKEEQPLLLTENQAYIHYQKGSVVMYALKDYLGEKVLNDAIKDYVQKVKFQGPPYTTTKEMLAAFAKVTPDSLEYILKDMFETITLYDNKVEKVTSKKEGDQYEVTIEFSTQKLRADGFGEEKEVEMKDYIDVGIFTREKVDGKRENVPVYFKKHLLKSGKQKLKIRVDKEPRSAGIDPYNKLVDRKPDDNERRVEK